MQNRLLLVFATASIVSLLTGRTGAATFFTEDFESYALDADVATLGGWTISNTAATVETETQWHLVDTKNNAFAFSLPPTVNYGPATHGGATTPSYDPTGEAAGGLFMVSRADGIPGSLFPTFISGTTPADPGLDDDDPWDSRLANGTYTGASSDIISPSFSTVAATGDVWLHASVSSQLNDNGQAVFDVDVSSDGGSTWVNHYRRISPGSGRNIASGDFDSDLDVDGADFLTQQRLVNFADCNTCGPNDNDIDRNRRDTSQRFSDWEKAFQGSYTPLVASIGATLGEGNAGGNHGELDLNLGAALGGQPNVKVRFRHFESRDDEIIVIDNVKVDEVAPAGSESNTIYSQDFNSLTLGDMGVYKFVASFGIFGVDTGAAASGGAYPTISGFSWGAQDRDSAEFPTGRYNADAVGPKGVNHLGHPTAEGANGEVPFAIIDPKAEEDNVGPDDNFQSERLHTPLLDLRGHSTIILEWDDEAIFDGNPLLGSVASVVLMEDTDGTAGPSPGDSIVAEPDKLVDIAAPYLPYDQFAGGQFESDDAVFEHNRLDISSLVAMATDKSKLYLAWQFFSSDTQYWAIDNIRLTGDGIPALAAFAAIPEPSSMLLTLLGISAFATTGRRLRSC